MALANSRWDLLRYKVRHSGLGSTMRVAYLDFSERVVTRVAKRFPSVAISPRSIQIECTTRCNLKCAFCELSYWKEAAVDVTLDTIKRMVRDLPRLKRVDLTGIGEALMNRDFFPMVEFLKSRGVYVTMNDNFTLMTEKNARRILELGVDHIFLSLDGATKATYESIRINANFEKVVANAKRLIALRRELGKKKPEVKINTVVCLSNYQELPAVVELAHEIGIGMVVFVNVITFDNTSGFETVAVKQDVDRKLQEAIRRGRELGVLVKCELFEKLPVQQCDYPWQRNFVTYDGYVHPCCHTTQTGDRKAQNSRSFGNLLQQSFDQLWKGNHYATFRRKMKQGILPTECAHCPMFVGTRDDSMDAKAATSAPLVQLTR